MIFKKHLILVTGILAAPQLYAHEDIETLDSVVVVGKAESDHIGYAHSASYGQANNEELSKRPFLRRGELLEVVPGMIVTQHAGGGKANQYFVRGYNLDHGTDFHVGLDGMPANHRTHAHGQGYADINFITPEFVERLDYFKGPFKAENGDLSTAGAAEYRLFQELPEGIFSATYGSYNYLRLVYGDSWDLGEGVLTLGTEYSHSDGPWDRPDDYDLFNLFARYHVGDEDNFWNLTFLAHDGEWNSSDQKPERAINSGAVSRFGSLDDTTGGDTSRYSLSTQWQKTDGETTTHVDAWVGTYDLQLFSNFTYELVDPGNPIVGQFEQNGSRVFAGANIWKNWHHHLGDYHAETTVGFQTRNDWIDDIGLYDTDRRNRLATVREDDVYVGSYSLFIDHETHFNEQFRAGAGLRGDLFHFDVDSNDPANSGNETDGILSPKAFIAYSPTENTELYLNGGLSFHSNDARGVTDGTSPDGPADPLVRTKGAEIGVRSNALKNLTTTFNLWYIESDSELIYVGDAGTSEAGDTSERWGIEAAAYWRPTDWFTSDIEYAWSNGKLVGVPAGEDEIENSVEHALSAGITLGRHTGWFSSLRARYFSPRPLNGSGSVESSSSFLVNGRIGYRKESWEASIDVLNIFDSDDNDIEYLYESRIPGEVAGVEGRHIQPTEPRQVRVNMTYRF